jgi:hypothetical protein
MQDKSGLSAHDLNVLRKLGEWQATAAASARNKEIDQAWRKHDRGAPDRRVMVIAEMWYTRDQRLPVPEESLQCQDPWARDVERGLRNLVYEVDQVRDDRLVSPYAEYSAHIHATEFGVPSGRHYDPQHADSLAFNYQPPLKKLDDADFARLQRRTFGRDLDKEARDRERVEAVFGGILPVRRRATWPNCHALTSQALDWVGLEGFMTLMYDNPQGLHRLMAFLRDDRLALIDVAEAEGVFTLTNEADYIGSGCMGCTDELPQKDFAGKVRARDGWLFTESQESIGLGPAQYAEFVFQYLRPIMARFGKVYYGCCEPVHPFLDSLAQAPTLARVSVSPWADEEKVGAFCRARHIVYSRKPSPNFYGAEKYDEGAVRADLQKTIDCARGCSLEFIQRDVLVTRDQPERFIRWVELVREVAG